MSFRPRTREFWLNVVDNRCQYEYYTERFGFVICNELANHVHHLLGERETLAEGNDPERNVALPLCQNHHVRFTGENLGDWNSSFHPDMGNAYTKYRTWKQNKLHTNSITGRKTLDYSDSPFADAAHEHGRAVSEGERYINGDEQTDQYYIDKMRTMAVRYLAEHPEMKKPDTKAHPNYDPGKKKHWWSV